MGLLGCAIFIPGPPGLVGTFQMGVYAGMTIFYPTATVVREGAAYVFLLYSVQVVCTLALALWGLAAEGGRGGVLTGIATLREAGGSERPAAPSA
jgi:hypothetical protein